MDKTVVITGGSKGIGRAIIERFAEEGYQIISCARNLDSFTDLITKYSKLKVFKADLSKKEEVLNFAASVKASCDQVDILINNTGVFLPGQIHQEEEGMLEKQIETNLYSAYHLTRALIGDMIARKEGDIFNICSIASITPYPNGGSYSISKYALMGMTKVLREEVKELGIRVTAVLPGATYTASWDGVDIPEERFIAPEDVAESIWSTHKLSRRTVIEELLIRPQLGDL